MVFHFTGVSFVAARALNVSFSIATVVLVYFLVRRYGGAETTAALAALLLAASPFAFAFSRLATLDTMVVFEWCLLLWVASYADPGRIWPSVILGVLIPIMLLTKTTAACLCAGSFMVAVDGTENSRAILAVSAIAGAGIGIYLFIVLRSRYADDYHYFFDINALADVEWEHTGFFPAAVVASRHVD